MFNTDTKRQLRVAEAFALGSTAIALSITFLLVTTAQAREANVLAAGAIETLGWYGTAVIGLGGTALAFVVFRALAEGTIMGELPDDDCRQMAITGGWLLAALSTILATNDVLVLARVGLPETFFAAEVAEFVAVAAIVAAGLFGRSSLRVPDDRLPGYQQLRAIAFAFVLVLSLVAAPVGATSLGTDTERKTTPDMGASNLNLATADTNPDDLTFNDETSNSSATSYTARQGKYVAYASRGDSTIRIAEVSSDGSLSYLGNVSDSNFGSEMAITFHNDRIYVGIDYDNPQVITIDATDKTNPTIVDQNTNSNYQSLENLKVFDGELYAFDHGSNTIYSYNISNPDNPSIDDSLALSDAQFGYGSGLAFSETHQTAYIVDPYAGAIHSVDISTPTNLLEAGKSAIPSGGTDAVAEMEDNNSGHLYVGSTEYLGIFDISDPNAVVNVSTYDNYDMNLGGFELDEGNAIAYQSIGSNLEEIGVFDVSSPDNIQLLGKHNKSEVSTQAGYELYNGNLLIGHGSGLASFNSSYTGGWGQTVSGQVVDQNGAPVANATVPITGITEAPFDTSDAQELREKANDLQDELENPEPPEWTNDLDPEQDIAENTNGKYVAAHSKGDWDLEGTTLGGRTVTWDIDPSLGTPGVDMPANEEFVLSVWDAGAESTFEDNVDASLPGSTTSGKVVVEQLAPTNETTDRSVEETEDTVRVFTLAGNQGSKTHETAPISLSAGFYRVYPESNPSASYVIAVGNPSEQIDSFQQKLEDRQGQLTDRADRIQNLIADDGAYVRTVRTDANGEFSADVPSNAVTAKVSAYKVDGVQLKDIENPSLSDLRDIQSGGYNGSFYISGVEPSTYQPPAEDITIRGYSVGTVPGLGINSTMDLLNWLAQQRLNETMTELETQMNQRLNETERQTLVAQYKSTRPLVETAPGAEDRYLDSSEFSQIQDAEDLSKEELYTELPLMRQALVPTDPITVEPPDIPDFENPEEGLSELTARFGIPDGISEDNINPRIHWSDGSVEPVPDEYWSIEQTGVLGQSRAVVVEYPIGEDDPPQGSLSVQVAAGGDDGGVGEGRVPIENPNFNGALPNIPAVELSTTAPGQDDRVSLNLRPEADTGFGELTRIDAVNAQGEPVETNITSDRGGWVNTDGQGVHKVFLTYENTGGQTFQRVVTVDAKPQPRSDPPEVRVSQGPAGPWAIAGNGLRSARITEDGDRVEVTAVAPADGDTPGRLTVKPDVVLDASTSQLDVRVVRGPDETSVSSHTRVDIHMDSVPEDALLWRGDPTWWGGQPLTIGDSASYGEVEQLDGGKTIVRTVTDENGEASVTVDQSPGFLEGIKHSIADSTPDIFSWSPLAWLPSLPVGPAKGAAVSGLIAPVGVAVWRRRGQSP